MVRIKIFVKFLPFFPLRAIPKKDSKELPLFKSSMGVNLELLKQLMIEDQTQLQYNLYLGGKKYPLTDVSITHSPTPVNSPTTRGGVYFSDKFAYKFSGTVCDLTIVPLLSKTMLGPNTEFGEIKITTTLPSLNKEISIFTNLTNSIQGPAKVELKMIIVKLK